MSNGEISRDYAILLPRYIWLPELAYDLAKKLSHFKNKSRLEALTTLSMYARKDLGQNINIDIPALIKPSIKAIQPNCDLSFQRGDFHSPRVSCSVLFEKFKYLNFCVNSWNFSVNSMPWVPNDNKVHATRILASIANCKL